MRPPRRRGRRRSSTGHLVPRPVVRPDRVNRPRQFVGVHENTNGASVAPTFFTPASRIAAPRYVRTSAGRRPALAGFVRRGAEDQRGAAAPGLNTPFSSLVAELGHAERIRACGELRCGCCTPDGARPVWAPRSPGMYLSRIVTSTCSLRARRRLLAMPWSSKCTSATRGRNRVAS